MSETLRYVPHHLIDQYESDGCEVVNTLSDCHHGEHAVLMRAPGEAAE